MRAVAALALALSLPLSAEAQEQADSMLKDAREQAQKETAALEAAAMKKQSAAIEKIIGRII